MKNIDFIHIATLFPVFKNHFEKGKPLPDFFPKLSSLEYDYLKYCMNACDTENRDYDLLRYVLEKNIATNINGVYENIRRVIFLNNIRKIKIKTIYDIGAGHIGYSDILSNIFPNAKIVLVDKKRICTNKYTFIEDNVFNFINYIKGNSDTLIWMSEFLHCKKGNYKILDNSEIKKCHILINELSENDFIDYRLKMTGGEITNPLDIYKYLGQIPFIKYETLFDYRLFYYEPKGDNR